MNILKDFFILKWFRNNRQKRLRYNSIKKVIDCIEIKLDKNEFDKIIKNIIIENFKETYPDTYNEEYLRNVEKIENIKINIIFRSEFL